MRDEGVEHRQSEQLGVGGALAAKRAGLLLGNGRRVQPAGERIQGLVRVLLEPQRALGQVVVLLKDLCNGHACSRER